MDLPLIWAVLIATAVGLYVLLDGFDLGVGILFPLASPKERDTMVASIAPVWDGNETWLVLGGGGLFAAFPLAYAIIMPALYLPIGLMLTALIFRGVAFEFRAHARKTGKRWWTVGFAGGSIAATVSQGLVLGGFLQGITIEGRAFAGGPFDWLTPYTLLVAAGLVAGYALLGAAWLVFKTDGELQKRARVWIRSLIVAVAVALGVISLVTLSLGGDIIARWGVSLDGSFVPAQFAKFAIIPVIGALACLAVWHFAMKGPDYMAYLATVGVFLSGFAGLAVSIFPHIVPFSVTVHEAAARDNALGLLLVGTAVMLPIILGYTAYVYWIFRGKAEPGAYH